MQQSQKQNSFSDFFAISLKSPSNFEHFEKQDDPDSLCIFEIKDCEKRG